MAATSFTRLLKTAYEGYWASDDSRTISRGHMKEAVLRLGGSYTDAELDVFFDLADKNHDGAIQYEEFIDFVFSNEEVASLADRELDLLHQVVDHESVTQESEIAQLLQESQSRDDAQSRAARLRADDEAEVERALKASAASQAAFVARTREVRQKEEEDERLFMEVLAKEAAQRDEALRNEEEAERHFLEASVQQAQVEAERRAEAAAAADQAELEAALAASEEAFAEHAERVRKQHEEEDGSDLFRAALRASCLDLGPRGVSQAAKVFSTGDATIGQPRATYCTATAGARGRRSSAADGSAPAYTGAETNDHAPKAGRVDSPGAQRRRAEWTARAGPPIAAGKRIATSATSATPRQQQQQQRRGDSPASLSAPATPLSPTSPQRSPGPKARATKRQSSMRR